MAGLPDHNRVGLSIGITTRNRPQALARCLRSLSIVDDLITEIIVVDDGSDVPVSPALGALTNELQTKLTFIRQPQLGCIAGRNTMMEMAKSEFVMLLDDDAFLVDDRGVRRALELIAHHRDVGAVACAMAREDGSPWPLSMQPSPVTYLACVPAYIGFAHLLRRSLFLELGRYRQLFYFYGEEKDYCLRLLNAGYYVVYDPQALVAHLADPAGRSPERYLRYVIRNDCLYSLCNEPFPLPLLSVPVRLYRYWKMRRHGGVDDPDGFRWIVAEVARALPSIVRERKPVRWASLMRWRRLRRTLPAFTPELA
jgi:GT2 family glycosyltransferase